MPNALLKCSPGLSFCIIHPNKHNAAAAAAAATERLALIPGVCAINGHRGATIALALALATDTFGNLGVCGFRDVLHYIVALLQ